MNNHPNTCFSCDEGHYLKQMTDYKIELPEGDTLTIPKLLILRCNKCDEVIIPPESSLLLEAAIDEHQETLTPEEARFFLKKFQVDQTEAAEALGMGAKTFHRWANGTQRVSRSMGFFLRAIMAHPELFDWIRNRRWRNSAKKSIETVSVATVSKKKVSRSA